MSSAEPALTAPALLLSLLLVWIGLGLVCDIGLYVLQRRFLFRRADVEPAARALGLDRARQRVWRALTTVGRAGIGGALLIGALGFGAIQGVGSALILAVSIVAIDCLVLGVACDVVIGRMPLRSAFGGGLPRLAAVLLSGGLAVAGDGLVGQPGSIGAAAAALGWGMAFVLRQALPYGRNEVGGRRAPIADAALAAALDGLAARCGFASADIRVLQDGPAAEAVGARVVRGPGRVRILVTRGLLQYLPADLLTPVIAHELGHARAHHIAVHEAIRGAAGVIYVAAGIMLVHAGWPGLGLPLVLLVLWLLAAPVAWLYQVALVTYRRRCEFVADAFACRHTSTAQLRAALERLFAMNPHRAGLHRLYRMYYATHPADQARLDALTARYRSANRES
ncbi:M48 family metallopeptidase [Salinisphaera sp. Q1T1-3]|uniref:M48 family metallopeptidase n=1 Tax=Salinisphaera sp. Q1T1-3 TaxID=2321229 RepID=UPI0013147912|nr:M48 family metalloprotease [Salinisphaera sp. Q1T1-3]